MAAVGRLTAHAAIWAGRGAANIWRVLAIGASKGGHRLSHGQGCQAEKGTLARALQEGAPVDGSSQVLAKHPGCFFEHSTHPLYMLSGNLNLKTQTPPPGSERRRRYM